MTNIRTAYPAPIAYTYEAAHHCPDCTATRFGVDESGFPSETAQDREGNKVGAIAPWDEWQQDISEPDTLACDTCGRIIEEYIPVEVMSGDYPHATPIPPIYPRP